MPWISAAMPGVVGLSTDCVGAVALVLLKPGVLCCIATLALLLCTPAHSNRWEASGTVHAFLFATVDGVFLGGPGMVGLAALSYVKVTVATAATVNVSKSLLCSLPGAAAGGSDGFEVGFSL